MSSKAPPTWNFEPRENTPQAAFDEAIAMWESLKFDDPVLIGEGTKQSPMCWSSVYDSNGKKFKPNAVYRGVVMINESFDDQKQEHVYSMKVDTSVSGNPDSFSRVERYQNRVSEIITEKLLAFLEDIAERGSQGEVSALKKGGKSFARTYFDEGEKCVKSFAYLKSMPRKDADGNLEKDERGKPIFEPVDDAPLRVGAKIKYNNKWNKWPTLNVNGGDGLKKLTPSQVIDLNNRDDSNNERRPYCKLDARVSLSLAVFIGSHGAQSPFEASVSTKVVKMTGKFTPYEDGDEITAQDEDEFGGSVASGLSSSARSADEDEFGGPIETPGEPTQQEVEASFNGLLGDGGDSSSDDEDGGDSGSDSPPPPPKPKSKSKSKRKK